MTKLTWATVTSILIGILVCCSLLVARFTSSMDHLTELSTRQSLTSADIQRQLEGIYALQGTGSNDLSSQLVDMEAQRVISMTNMRADLEAMNSDHTTAMSVLMNQLSLMYSSEYAAWSGIGSQLNAVNDSLDAASADVNTGLADVNATLADMSSQLQKIDSGVVWSYGTGLPGVGEGELYSPHMAEELDGDKVLITEQKNCDVIVVDKISGKIVWQFGERGVSGTGARLSSPHSAHRLPDGRILVTEMSGDHRVIIVNYQTGAVEWEYTGCAAPLDAIYWDDEHIMVADWGEKDGETGRIVKVRFSDKSEVWTYDTPAPFYLQRLTTGDYGQSYGGDLLFGQVGNAAVKEIDTSTGAIVWQYGQDGANWPYGEVYDAVWSGVCALRYGISEVMEYKNPALTIIVCENWSKVFAVNKAKQLVWEIGGTTGLESTLPAFGAFPLYEPTNVSVTKAGSLLITDHGQNRVIEVNPWSIEPRTDKEARLCSDLETTDSWTDTQIAEVVGYVSKNIMMFNTGAYGCDWRILGSPDAAQWVEIQTGSLDGQGSISQVISAPWRFIRVQVRSTDTGLATTVNVYLHASRA